MRRTVKNNCTGINNVTGEDHGEKCRVESKEGLDVHEYVRRTFARRDDLWYSGVHPTGIFKLDEDVQLPRGVRWKKGRRHLFSRQKVLPKGVYRVDAIGHGTDPYGVSYASLRLMRLDSWSEPADIVVGIMHGDTVDWRGATPYVFVF